ncbi:sulfatase-like hydrolase/transferase [Reichenbachiella agarivorans]|uniref:Sulfatase-like hydrolase/transferase n=1 Tax=Reichenbachiella agarivorans TaxID=2979464 RepID=A0ABY6CNF0_9BACT|nr:sulfatase-like hydrolase/transferase [Reichenbachiella agarivorans]UXP32049.1 sulfatase-like hydrolase/transferase [Reichenbachiella agarivorans]
MIKRSISLGCVLILLVPILALARESKKRKDRPNVLIIVSDDQGWGDVGFNGGTDIPTPNLDALAADGVSFEAGYASHPYCSPSRAGLLSGRYQQHFGHECNIPYTTAGPEDGLPLDELLLSELLQQKGYRTCAVGKWHLGDDEKFWPSHRGFDDWYGFFGGGSDYWGALNGKDPVHGVLRDGTPVARDSITYLTDDFSREAISYIDRYAESDDPFFMYLAYNAPHAPIQATQEYIDQVAHIEEGARAAYAAMVVGMDQGIGRVIDKLKETGEYDNTLIVFYSDNGAHTHGASSAPYRGHKGMLFEGGIRVPFLISWPKGIEGGQRYEAPIFALDVFPTVLAAAHLQAPKSKSLDGVDLLPYLNGVENEEPHEVLFWRYSGGAGYAVRKDNYKLVMSAYKEKTFLFDLESDPYEHNDLSAEQPEKVQELLAAYMEWNRENVVPKWDDPHASNVSKEETKRQEVLDRASAGEKR